MRPTLRQFLLHKFFFIIDSPEKNEQKSGDQNQGQPGPKRQRNSTGENNNSKIPGMSQICKRPTCDNQVRFILLNEPPPPTLKAISGGVFE